MKTILITGGTSGIGFETALKLTFEYNFRVIITGSNPEKLQNALKKLPATSTGYLCDNNDMTSITKLSDQLISKHSYLDGVFLNAGICNFNSFSETTEKEFDEMMMVNFKGNFFILQKILPLIKENGSIVLTSSIVTKKAFAKTGVYSASKGALEALASVLNLELADTKIRVNVISPGVTMTPVFARAGMNDNAVKEIESSQESTLLGRIIQPEEIADTVGFLMSDKSIAMRNSNIVIDGGTLV